jgi:hypothetical protein
MAVTLSRAAMYLKLCRKHNTGAWAASSTLTGFAQWLHLLQSKKSKYFRWHDSGDVQDLKHLAKIFKVARLTPDVKHWMPTREAWVKPYLKYAPANLVIRFSMPMVDQEAAASWPNTSTVVTDSQKRTCPAPDQDNACKDCRACWDPNVKNVAYGQH